MPANILVVDDEESIRFTFEAFLAEEGYAVTTAASLEQALQRCAASEFDLIFSDILLGGGSGVELLRQLRAKNPACPVVMITGFPTLETATEALRLGAYDYIPKPVTQEILLRVTRMALRFKQLSAEKRGYQAHLEAVFRSVKDAIVTVDPQARLVECNAAAAALCGLDRSRIGQPFAPAGDPCQGHCGAALAKTLAEQTPQTLERFECQGPGGGARVMTLNTAPLRDVEGGFLGAVLVLRDETRLNALERDLQQRPRFHNMIGISPRMQEIYDLLEKLAQVPTTVLVTGESGTGKELIADALHHKGVRRNGPLIKVNCSALSENLLETELFGHVRGAFTGAVKDSPGRFELARGGTIFLDEIGDISPRLQVRLLRVLQEKVIERVGDARPIPVDVRVIAATNQDLAAKIRRGEFREDLFYRLKVVNLTLPPLRERRQDIPLLIEHFREKFNRLLSRQVRGVSPQVEHLLLSAPWPGNVRELEHVLEHACVLCRGDVLCLEDLPADLLDHASPPVGSAAEIGGPDLAAIQQALLQAGGNKAKAARLLAISRRTLYRKLEQLAPEPC
jgi:two-component system, NtrC family, response regulator HydG